MNEVLRAFSFPFVRYALWALSAGALVCGMLGPFVLMRRIGFIAGGISHALLGVVGVAILWGISPYYVALPSAVILALIMGWVERRAGEGFSDVAIALIWTLGMSIGLVALSRVKGYTPDVMSYLFGNVLLLSKSDVLLAWIVAGIITIVVEILFYGLVSVSVDEEFACAQGIPIRGLYYILLSLIGLGIVVLLKTLGIILMIAMLIIPPAVACRRARGMRQLILFSIAVAWLAGILGFWIAYFGDISVSAAVVFVLAAMYIMFSK